MASLMRIYALKDPGGRRIWCYRCRECTDARGESRNFHAQGNSYHWEWALDDANWHLETYH